MDDSYSMYWVDSHHEISEIGLHIFFLEVDFFF